MRTGSWLFLALAACGLGTDSQSECSDSARIDAWTDVDGDGAGDAATKTSVCFLGSGQVDNGDDCNDANASIFPRATEVCDGIDQDCDGFVDEGLATGGWYTDADGDGFGDSASAYQGCEKPDAAIGTGGDCDDTNPDISPMATEVCDGIDNNCNAIVDDDSDEAVLWTVDGDGDGVGAGPALGPAKCEAPQPDAVPMTDPEDCADGNPLVHPGAQDICGDGIDQDCSGGDASCGPIGSFYVSDGPAWGGNPPVYSCVEACALLFGGVAGDYHCSTSQAVEDFKAYVSGYADATYCTTPVAETFSKGAGGYNCGAFGCSYSAYVTDNCYAPAARNFCWPI
jgi:hypothetical protein